MGIKCPNCHFENPDDTLYCGKCATSLYPSKEIPISKTETLRTPVKQLSRGTPFAKRYEVIEELGKGGMGRVYRVIDKKIEEEVALKLLNPEIAADKKTVERFRNELKLARKITHRNVCRMYDLSEENGTLYITMEYVPGEDLKSSLKRMGPLSAGKAIFIAKQVCDGLAEAHRLGVVHRDLKPQNIMIDKEGNARIMDFGIARSLKAEGLTESGMIIGTPQYMSPEQVEGIALDQRSDIYSLGIILYEMVTGQVPFEGNTPYSIAFKQKTEEPPNPRIFNDQIPEDLNRVILRCLEKHKENRYQSVHELITEFNNIERGIPTTERVAPRRKTEARRPRKWSMSIRLSLSFIIAAVIITGGYFSYNLFLKPGKKGTEEKAAAIPEKKPQKKETPPATPLYGQIEISSTPEGAEVYLDDKHEGVTPLKRELTPGTHRLRIKKSPDYKDMTDVLDLKAGETFSRNYTLVPVPKSTKPKTPETRTTKPKAPVYSLRISTNPSGADVRIDGNYKGKTPISIDLSKRSCRLKIERGEEWSAIDEPVTLEPGSNSIHRDLRRIKYRLSIKTNPSEARVLIGDELFGTTPVNKLASVGQNKIKIEKQGYRIIEETINIVADTEKTYNLTTIVLGKAKIRIKVHPYADVLIDGTLIGEVPPIRVQEIEAGKHTIEFVSSRLNKKFTVDLEIKAGENKEIRMNMETGKHTVVKLDSLQ